MPKEAITERLKFLTEMIRLAFIAFLAIGGSAISLLLGHTTSCAFFWRLLES